MCVCGLFLLPLCIDTAELLGLAQAPGHLDALLKFVLKRARRHRDGTTFANLREEVVSIPQTIEKCGSGQQQELAQAAGRPHACLLKFVLTRPRRRQRRDGIAVTTLREEEAVSIPATMRWEERESPLTFFFSITCTAPLLSAAHNQMVRFLRRHMGTNPGERLFTI